MRELWKNNLVQITRLTALERDGARVEGERAQLMASVAQAKGKITETELQIIQIDQDLSSEVAKDMREVDAKFGEFVERKVTAEDQLKRIDLRAPQDGIVLESKVHTVGGVIPAGDAIMQIVPESDNLLVEAKVNPHDIDQVQIGQSAVLRFSAFNLRTTPEINGTVTRVSRRYYDGSTHRSDLLHNAHRNDRKTKSHASATSSSFRACRSKPSYKPANARSVLSNEALARPIHAGVPGKMTASPPRQASGDFR